MGTLPRQSSFVKSSFYHPDDFENFAHFGIAAPKGNLLGSLPAPLKPSFYKKSMVNILGISTAIILAIAALVAVKNKSRLETEILGRATKLQELSVSQARLVTAQETLTQVPIDRAVIDAQATAKTGEQTGLKVTIESLKEKIEAETKKVASNKKALDVIRTKSSEVGNVKDLVDKMKAMRADSEEIVIAVSSSEATLANLTSQNTAAQAEADRRKAELDTFTKGESLPSLTTSIRSIFPAWGFVTLADGNNNGVISGSTLDVVRDGQTVARLLVTAVETRSSTASIIPDSLADDVTLMVGDRVLPGTKDEKPPADPQASSAQ